MLSKTMAVLFGIISEKPSNGYEIIKMMENMKIERWYRIGNSTVYATLKKAESKGYIYGTIEKEGNMPDKTIYSLTNAGVDKLKKTVCSFVETFEYDLVPFMIGCFFIDVLTQEEQTIAFENRVNNLERYSSGLSLQIEHVKKQSIPEYVLLNIQHSKSIVEVELSTAKLFYNKIKPQA